MKYRLILQNQQVEVETPELSQIQILLNKQFEALENPTKYYTEYSRSIQIPFTSFNNRLFSNIFKCDSVITNKSIDPKKKLDFILLYNNEIITRGYAKLSNIYDDGKNKYYVLNLFSSLGYIFNEIKQFTFDNTNTEIDSKYVIENPLSDGLVINKQLVKEAFEKTDYELDINKKSDLDYITFFPQFQGKYSNFSSDKMEISNSIYDIGAEYDEHQVRSYRSYYQGVGIWVNAIIQLIKHKIESISDYKVVLSKEWFNASNPYWKDLIYTMPTLYREDSENIDTTKKEKYKILFNQYKYNILSLSDLSNSHKQILPFERSSGDYLYNAETKYFNIYGGNSCHFHEQLNYTLFIADTYNSGFGGYCRIKDDNCLYLTIKAIDANNGTDIVGASTTYMFYSDENDRLETTQSYDYAIDIGITSRNYPNAITNADVGYEKDKGFYWQGDLIADFEVRTDRPFCIVADIRTANNGKLTERAISEYVPQWDWLWVDNWQSSNDFGYTNGLTFFITCVEAEVENIENVRTNSKITFNRLWDTDETIYDVFMKYLKQFHLMVDLDEEEKTITISTKEKYFQNYKVVDWSNRLDRTKNLSIIPSNIENRYLMFGYKDGVGQRYDYYQKKYNTSYGRYRIDTGIEFNNNETTLIENLNPSMVCTKKMFSIYNNVKNPDGADFKGYGWKHYPNEAFVENDNNGVIANNYGSFYFHCGTYEPDSVLSKKDSNNKCYIEISDDTATEIKQNTYCWNNSNNVKCYSFPLISAYDRSGKYSIYFQDPKEIYFSKEVVPYNNPKGLYKLFWEKYLNEIYSIQNKFVTAYIYLDSTIYKNFKFNEFVVIDNVLYRVVAIKDYDVSSTSSTKVEMIQVSDISAYTTNNFDLPYLFTEQNNFSINEKTTIEEEVFSSSDWVIDNCSTWLNCYKVGNSIRIDNVLPTNRNRLGSIQIKNNDGLTYTILVSQKTTESFLTIDKNNITFERSGGSQRIGIDSYPDTITIVDSPNWITTTLNKSAFGNTLVVSADSNTSRLGRNGIITISNGLNTETIRVAQQASNDITITTTNGETITKPIVIPTDGETTIITTLNKPIDPNTLVVSNDTTPLKPTTTIGDISLKITPKTTEISDGGRVKVYTVDGKPIVIDYNVGYVDVRYTIYIQNTCIINAKQYETYYDSVLEGTELNIEVIVPQGKTFVGWSDGNTNKIRTITCESDITLYPIFENIVENVYSFDDDSSIEFDNNTEIKY